MSERSVRILPDRTYTEGERVTPTDVDVDDDILRVVLMFDRATWATTHAETLIEWTMERSYDGGRWVDGGGSGTHGGVIISDGGIAYPMSKWVMTLPPGRNRKLRFEVTVKRATRTIGDVDTLATR